MLRVIAHAHPISGELDFHQRLEFLRYHIDRHIYNKRNIKIFLKLLKPQNYFLWGSFRKLVFNIIVFFRMYLTNLKKKIK